MTHDYNIEVSKDLSNKNYAKVYDNGIQIGYIKFEKDSFRDVCRLFNMAGQKLYEMPLTEDSITNFYTYLIAHGIEKIQYFVFYHVSQTGQKTYYGLESSKYFFDSKCPILVTKADTEVLKRLYPLAEIVEVTNSSIDRF